MSTNAGSRLSSHTTTAALAAAVAAIVAPLVQSAGPERDIQAVEDVDRPSAEDLVWIFGSQNQAETYTVPQGKDLVLTGGNSQPGTVISLRIDGGPERLISPGNDATIQFATGIRLGPGQTLTLDPSDWRSLFGYLVDA